MYDSKVFKLELHYYLVDNSHQMDAFVLHKCEGEILKIIKQIGHYLQIDLDPQVEARAEGGLKDILSFVKGHPILLAIASGVLINVLSDFATIDRELINLQKENLRLEKEQKQLDLYLKRKQLIDGDQAIIEDLIEDLLFLLTHEYQTIRARSDFYKKLVKYDKVVKISGQQLNELNEPLSAPNFVVRDDFPKFILFTDDVPSEIIEDVVIEIVSPVLKKGSFKWKGVCEGNTIDFYMKDKDFKDQVFNQNMSFVNGVKLKVVLEISRKMNEVGEIYDSGYSVLTVLSHGTKDDFSETPQGNKYFLNKKAQSKQLDLF